MSLLTVKVLKLHIRCWKANKPWAKRSLERIGANIRACRPIQAFRVACLGHPQVLVRFEAQQRRQRRRLQQPQLDLAEALHEEQRQAMAECLDFAPTFIYMLLHAFTVFFSFKMFLWVNHG